MKIPTSSFFLFGARGTGKTTFLETHLNPKLSVELLSQENFIKYGTDPGLLRRQLEPLNPGDWVWIDEVQRLPHLLNEVHWGIEKKKLRFALSGSSARKLRKAGVNLLAGRALSYNFFPFIPCELGNDFDLDLTLSQGSIPLIQSSSQPKQQLRAYVFNYLKEEIQAEALVKDIPSFARFLKVASLLNAQELNLSSVSRDAGVKRATVENYFSILEDTLLGFILRPFESGIRIKERRHPKFYWLDAGVVRAIREEWGPITASEKGPLFESYILTLLRAYQSYLDAFDEISYWATPNVEVDFVIKKNSKYYAIEVKSSERFRPEDLSGLKSISDLKNLRKRILVYPKMETQQTDDGILILGFDEFNRRLEDQSLFV